MCNRVVLCVDDESIILLSIKHALRAALGNGYRYETALSAESALGLLRELRSEGVEIAAVVSDWLMPGMRGDEFLRNVAASLPEACLILLTGYADVSAVKALEHDVGLAAIFQKPVDMARIARVIKDRVQIRDARA